MGRYCMGHKRLVVETSRSDMKFPGSGAPRIGRYRVQGIVNQVVREEE